MNKRKVRVAMMRCTRCGSSFLKVQGKPVTATCRCLDNLVTIVEYEREFLVSRSVLEAAIKEGRS